MKNTNKIINDKIRAIICAAIIFGLLASFAFRQTNLATVSAQTAENEIAASPDSTALIFRNPTAITINDNTTATGYPATVTVSGVNPAIVTRVQVQLNGFSHTFPDDVDIILVGPQGQRSMIMSDAGGSPDAVNLNLLFDQTAANILPDAGPLVSGTTRPANYENAADTFPAPGPGALTGEPADLSVFNLTNPNGVWRLYVVDDASGDTGQISGGWTLVLTVPTVFTVTNTNDSGAGSLRAALAAAQDGDLINFSSAFNTPQTINLLTALPDINTSVTIQGTGANLLTVRRDVNAATSFRIFNIGGATNGVVISGMTITGGSVGSGFGGGINSISNLSLTNVHVTGNQAGSGGGGVGLGFAGGVFMGCTFSGNTGSQGGGIDYEGNGNTLRLVNSTVSGNMSNFGGGIRNFSANSRVEITSSTIVNNIGGDGISTFAFTGDIATTTLRNTIIAGNTPNNLSAGGGGTVTTNGFNLTSDNGGGFLNVAPVTTDKINANAGLAPLALNGGTTPTHALLFGSAALDAGNNSGSGVLTDQRGAGFNRTVDLPIANAPNSDGTDIGAFEAQTAPVATAKTPFDFTGDGKADLSVFRPSNGGWYIYNLANNTNLSYAFGLSTDTIVPADYDGDGKTDVAVYRSGTWYLNRSQLGFTGVAFGAATDIPMPADFDGDGKAELAVFRPSNGGWYLYNLATNQTSSYAFGQAGDVPVAADYDGDNKADVAVFRSGTWYIQRSQLGFTGIAFGQNGDKPVPADYDGDGKTDVAVFRAGTWFLLRSTLGFTSVTFGAGTDIPTAADYDGDGKADVAVFRPSTGTWYLQQSTAGFTGAAFGANGDKPVPSAFVP